MTLKAYTKGEHVLRFEAVVHNTKQLRCGRVLDRFPEIIGRLAGMVDRFATTLDCVDVTFIGDGILDQLPAPSQIGATRVGGVDVNKPRIRAALSAALALSTAPGGFTATEFTTKVHTMTGQTLLTLREQVIAPILAGVRSPRLGRKPTTWTRVDRDYETLRINMQTLFHDLGITTTRTAAA